MLKSCKKVCTFSFPDFHPRWATLIAVMVGISWCRLVHEIWTGGAGITVSLNMSNAGGYESVRSHSGLGRPGRSWGKQIRTGSETVPIRFNFSKMCFTHLYFHEKLAPRVGPQPSTISVWWRPKWKLVSRSCLRPVTLVSSKYWHEHAIIHI